MLPCASAPWSPELAVQLIRIVLFLSLLGSKRGSDCESTAHAKQTVGGIFSNTMSSDAAREKLFLEKEDETKFFFFTDGDGDGLVSRVEFNSEFDADQAFSCFDLDKDGVLRPDEYRLLRTMFIKSKLSHLTNKQVIDWLSHKECVSAEMKEVLPAIKNLEVTGMDLWKYCISNPSWLSTRLGMTSLSRRDTLTQAFCREIEGNGCLDQHGSLSFPFPSNRAKSTWPWLLLLFLSFLFSLILALMRYKRSCNFISTSKQHLNTALKKLRGTGKAASHIYTKSGQNMHVTPYLCRAASLPPISEGLRQPHDLLEGRNNPHDLKKIASRLYRVKTIPEASTASLVKRRRYTDFLMWSSGGDHGTGADVGKFGKHMGSWGLGEKVFVKNVSLERSRSHSALDFYKSKATSGKPKNIGSADRAGAGRATPQSSMPIDVIKNSIGFGAEGRPLHVEEDSEDEIKPPWSVAATRHTTKRGLIDTASDRPAEGHFLDVKKNARDKLKGPSRVMSASASEVQDTHATIRSPKRYEHSGQYQEYGCMGHEKSDDGGHGDKASSERKAKYTLSKGFSSSLKCISKTLKGCSLDEKGSSPFKEGRLKRLFWKDANLHLSLDDVHHADEKRHEGRDRHTMQGGSKQEPKSFSASIWMHLDGRVNNTKEGAVQHGVLPKSTPSYQPQTATHRLRHQPHEESVRPSGRHTWNEEEVQPPYSVRCAEALGQLRCEIPGSGIGSPTLSDGALPTLSSSPLDKSHCHFCNTPFSEIPILCKLFRHKCRYCQWYFCSAHKKRTYHGCESLQGGK